MSFLTLLCGYEPSRPFRTDFDAPAEVIRPVRELRPDRHDDKRAYRRWREVEARCAECGDKFKRKIRSDQSAPTHCSKSCSGRMRSARRWREDT